MYKTIVELEQENKMLKAEILRLSNISSTDCDLLKAHLRELLWRVTKVQGLVEALEESERHFASIMSGLTTDINKVE